MAPIQIKEVIGVSSEDATYLATNLINGNKWMTNSKDQNVDADVELQFESLSQIDFLDIGYFNVSSLEVLVSKSNWPTYRSHAILLPTVILQNSMDARLGAKKSGCKMYRFSDHFDREVGKQEWDKVKLVLHQPYARNKQMGIEFVRFGMVKSNKNTKVENKTSTNLVESSASKVFQESSFAKIINTTNKQDNQALTEKWRKISSSIDGVNGANSVMSRTAKMVVASQLKSPKVMSNTTACNDVHKEKRTKEFTKMSPARLKRMQLIKEKQNISENTHVQVKANQKSYQNLKQQKLEQISLSSPHNKDSNVTPKINETPVHRGENSDIKNNPPTTSATSKEASPTYTQKQIKKLKKAIKSFFTDLDANQFNVEELTVKELRQNFEFGNGITLNKDGRKYFTDVGAKYLSFLLQNEQKNEGNNMQENRDHNRNKRKSSEASTSHSGSYESPAKVKRVGQTSSNIHNVQCPICLSMFSGSEIENHAALCGSVDTNDIQVLAHTTPTSNTVVDCSDNSSLSKQEQENWIKYSQKPKPYQKRLNCSEYENTLLARCPTCGQKYKASEIEIHSDECAEKVFSGYTRMGLHLVKTKKEGKKPKTAQLLTGPIMID